MLMAVSSLGGYLAIGSETISITPQTM